MPYLSTMLGMRVEGTDGDLVGRLEDVVAVPGAKFPPVRGIMVGTGHGRKRRSFFIPWSEMEMRDKVLEIELPETGAEPDFGDIFLARDLLDKQIVDMEGYKIVRVSDVRLAESGASMRVIGADVGVLAILRRLGFGRAAGWLGERGYVKDRIVPWNLVSPIDPMPFDVRLRVPYRRFLEIHPSDVADIIEQLDVEQRAKVLALIEDPKAAEVLSYMLPEVRSSIAEAMGDSRMSELLEIMPPDEAADILGSLSRGKAQLLLRLMGIKEAAMVGELLGYEPDSAGGRMTTEFVSIPKTLTSQEAIEYLRSEDLEAETIYYVYVVDGDGHLSGVLSLRDLLRSPPAQVVEQIMIRDVITVDLEDDQELAAEQLSRYNLLAVPVVDRDFVLKGIITVDDAIDVIMEESAEDFSQLSGVALSDEGTPVRNAFDRRRWATTVLAFLGGILATALFGMFRSAFIAAFALVYFVPPALRAAHDVSVWSMAAAVRELDHRIETGESGWRVVAREYSYTLSAALIISVLCLMAGLVWTGSSWQAVAGVAGLFTGVAVAGMLGLAIPVMLRRAKPDPAVGVGKLVAVTVMAASMVSFLVVSALIVNARG